MASPTLFNSRRYRRGVRWEKHWRRKQRLSMTYHLKWAGRHSARLERKIEGRREVKRRTATEMKDGGRGADEQWNTEIEKIPERDREKEDSWADLQRWVNPTVARCLVSAWMDHSIMDHSEWDASWTIQVTYYHCGEAGRAITKSQRFSIQAPIRHTKAGEMWLKAN